jgi:hypothetical protein
MMKLSIKLFFILLATALFTGFTACSDDEKDNPAKEIAGTYEGAITGGVSVTDVEIKVEYLSENEVNLYFNETILGIPFDIICKTAVTKEAGIYHLNGNTNVEVVLQENTPALPIPVAITGTMTVALGVKAAEINITVGTGVDYPLFPLPLVFTGVAE